MFTTTLPVLLAITILSFQGVHCDPKIPPSNAAVVQGNRVTLECASSLGSSFINWFIINPSGSGVTNIVTSCAVETGYIAEYTIDNSVTEHCDLVILNVSSTTPLSFSCVDTGRAQSAFLTVLASVPTCGSNTTTNLIPENNVDSSSCSVSYASASSGPTAKVTWSAGCTLSPTVTNTTTLFSSSATVIARRPTLQSCTGTTSFTAPPPQPNVATNPPTYSYSWSSRSNIPVSYCPTVTISSTNFDGFQNTTELTCSAVAYPNVTTSGYAWTADTGSGRESGQTYTVTSVGNYSIRCTATNDLLGGTSSPCSISATATGKTVASYCPKNITITKTIGVNTFLCSADASPPVSVYQWTYNNTVVVGNDRTYTVPSNVNYTITCNVTNYLYNNTGDPCSGSDSLNGTSQPPTNKQFSDGEIAGIVIGSVCGAAIIIGGLVFLFAPSCAANRMSCSQLCRPGEKYKKSEPNAPSASTGNGRNPQNNQMNEMETISSPTYPQHPDHSPQYNPHQTGYEQGQQQLIYADLTKPGESLPGIHNQPGSRKPVTPQEENPYAAVERA